LDRSEYEIEVANLLGEEYFLSRSTWRSREKEFVEILNLSRKGLTQEALVGAEANSNSSRARYQFDEQIWSLPKASQVCSCGAA
jgi:hypothetical protein